MDKLAAWISCIGLIANFGGTVLLAYSFGPNPDDAHQFDRGRKILLASFTRPRFFKFGLGLVAVGFLLQALAAGYALL